MDSNFSLMIDSALRGAAAMVVFMSAVLLIRDGHKSWIGRFGALFAVGILNYLVCSASWFQSLPQQVFVVVLTFCFVNPVLFWLFARSLFDDDFNPGWGEAGVAFGLIGIGFVRYIWGHNWPVPAQDASAVVMQLVSIFLVAHIFALAIRGRRDDLIEDRRRFRLVFVAGIGIYVLSVSVAEISLVGEEPPAFLRSLNLLGILILTIAVNLRINRLRRDELLGKLIQPHGRNRPVPDTPQRMSPSSTSLASADVAALERLMRQDKPYLTEGLTISALTQALKIPEYRLRHAINQEMGFRNFPAFLNSYRLEEAKLILANPDQARLPILTIALDLGYGSIGPFNRAFKQETGVTPTAFRKAALEKVPV